MGQLERGFTVEQTKGKGSKAYGKMLTTFDLRTLLLEIYPKETVWNSKIYVHKCAA